MAWSSAPGVELLSAPTSRDSTQKLAHLLSNSLHCPRKWKASKVMIFLNANDSCYWTILLFAYLFDDFLDCVSNLLYDLLGFAY